MANVNVEIDRAEEIIRTTKVHLGTLNLPDEKNQKIEAFEQALNEIVQDMKQKISDAKAKISEEKKRYLDYVTPQKMSFFRDGNVKNTAIQNHLGNVEKFLEQKNIQLALNEITTLESELNQIDPNPSDESVSQSVLKKTQKCLSDLATNINLDKKHKEITHIVDLMTIQICLYESEQKIKNELTDISIHSEDNQEKIKKSLADISKAEQLLSEKNIDYKEIDSESTKKVVAAASAKMNLEKSLTKLQQLNQDIVPNSLNTHEEAELTEQNIKQLEEELANLTAASSEYIDKAIVAGVPQDDVISASETATHQIKIQTSEKIAILKDKLIGFKETVQEKTLSLKSENQSLDETLVLLTDEKIKEMRS